MGTDRLVSKLMNHDPQVEERDRYFYHPDHLGSSNYVTDANGQVYEHLEYFPFGEVWVEEASNTQRAPYLFTSKELDEETGLYYYGARYYDPRTSVWQSPDPLVISNPEEVVKRPQVLSAYTYANNDPLVFTDPDGRDVLIVVGHAKKSFDRVLDQAVRNKLESQLTGAGIKYKLADLHAAGVKNNKAALDAIKEEAQEGGAAHPVTGVVVISHGSPKGFALAPGKQGLTLKDVKDASGVRQGGAFVAFACRVGQANSASLKNDNIGFFATKERINFFNNGTVSFDSSPGNRTTPGETVFPGSNQTVLQALSAAQDSAGKAQIIVPMAPKDNPEVKLGGN